MRMMRACAVCCVCIDPAITDHPILTTPTAHTATPYQRRASDYPGAASASASGASAPAPAQADKTIYVEGISYQATEEDLTRFFQDKGCGKVVAVRMPRYQDSGRPRGYAHLDFKKPEGVAKALTLNGVTMMGRYLSVQRANEPRQGPGGAGAMPATAKPPGMCAVLVCVTWWLVWGFGWRWPVWVVVVVVLIRGCL